MYMNEEYIVEGLGLVAGLRSYYHPLALGNKVDERNKYEELLPKQRPHSARIQRTVSKFGCSTILRNGAL